MICGISGSIPFNIHYIIIFNDLGRVVIHYKLAVFICATPLKMEIVQMLGLKLGRIFWLKLNIVIHYDTFLGILINIKCIHYSLMHFNIRICHILEQNVILFLQDGIILLKTLDFAKQIRFTFSTLSEKTCLL